MQHKVQMTDGEVLYITAPSEETVRLIVNMMRPSKRISKIECMD